MQQTTPGTAYSPPLRCTCHVFAATRPVLIVRCTLTLFVSQISASLPSLSFHILARPFVCRAFHQMPRTAAHVSCISESFRSPTTGAQLFQLAAIPLPEFFHGCTHRCSSLLAQGTSSCRCPGCRYGLPSRRSPAVSVIHEKRRVAKVMQTTATDTDTCLPSRLYTRTRLLIH